MAEDFFSSASMFGGGSGGASGDIFGDGGGTTGGMSLGSTGGGGGQAGPMGLFIGGTSDIFSGIGDLLSGQATSNQLRFRQHEVENFTKLQQLIQRRQAYQIQSRASAEIGASGLATGGSADEIMRMNAQNLALEGGIIGNKGAVEAGAIGNEAKAAMRAGQMGMLSKGLQGAAQIIAGIAEAA